MPVQTRPELKRRRFALFIRRILTRQVDKPSVVKIVFCRKRLFIPFATANRDTRRNTQRFRYLFHIDELRRSFAKQELELIGRDKRIELRREYRR